MLEISALLPIKILYKYKLNDRFVINGKQYTINKVSSNLMSGRSNLELISEIVEPFVQPRNIIIAFGSYTDGLDVPINIVTYGGCDSSTIQWSTDPAFPSGGTPVSAGCSGETIVTMPSYSTFYYRAFSIDVNDPSNTAISNIISKTITQATYYTPEVLRFGATDVLACSGSNVTLYISSADGLYYDSASASGNLVNGSFYSNGTNVYTFVDGVKNDTGYCFSYSAQTFKYSAVQQDSCSGTNATLYYNPQDGLYYTAGDGTGTLFTGSYYSNGNFIYSFSNGAKTQVATCDTFTSESYTYDANITNVCDSTLFIDLYISSNDGLYYYSTSGVGSPVSGGYYFKDGNIYSFSNGVRSLVNPCTVIPEPEDFVMTIDTRISGPYHTNEYQFKLNAGSGTYTVLWGDGSSSTQANPVTHTYNSSGVYTVVVKGYKNAMSFLNSSFARADSNKLLSIEQFGDYTPTSGSRFAGCINLDLSGVSDVFNIGGSSAVSTFSGCTSLTSINNVSQWNVSSITNMEQMFYGCINLNIDLSNWNVSNVTRCGGFAFNTPKWTLPKPNFTNCTP
jgi:surface protein